MSTPVTQPILKLASPPGTGKTRLLVQTALRWIAEGLRPERVYLLCWTSAQQEQLEAMLYEECQLAGRGFVPLRIERWDTFLEQFIRRFSEDSRLGHAVRGMTDQTAQLVLRGLLGDMARTGEIPEQLQILADSPEGCRRLFEALQQPETAAPEHKDFKRFFETVHDRFQSHTTRHGLLLYSQLPAEAVAMLREKPALRSRWHDHIDGLLIDDAQELTATHDDLLQLLLEKTRLAFAGNSALATHENAEPDRFEKLHERFTPITDPRDPETITCYRGNEALLYFLSGWKPYFEKPLWEARTEKDIPTPEQLRQRISARMLKDPVAESHAIAQYLCALKTGDADFQWPDAAIFLAGGKHRDTLATVFTEYGIPLEAEIPGDETLNLQHVLYDGGQVIRLMHELGVTDFSVPEISYKEYAAPAKIETLIKLDALIRHLYRLTVTIDKDASLSHPQGTHTQPEEALATLAKLASHSTVRPVCRQMEALYQNHQGTPSLTRLAWELVVIAKGVAQLAAETTTHEGPQLARFLKQTEAMESLYNKTLDRSPTLAEWLAGFETLWPAQGVSSRGVNAVRVLPVSQSQGLNFRHVVIPFMTAMNYPSPHAEEFTQARQLATAITRASQSVWLSGHDSHDESGLLPSPFFTALARILYPDGKLPEEEENGNAPPISDLPHTYEGNRVWAQLNEALENASPIFDADETLRLHPSALDNYITCPRKFYYKNLLNLQEAEKSKSASVGLLVHKLMEVFNTPYDPGTYTPDRLRELTVAVFDTPASDRTPLIEKGFDADTLSLLDTLSPVEYAELRKQVTASIESLIALGYFDYMKGARQILAEQYLEAAAIDGIDRVLWSGVVDALIEHENGQWDVVDYKNYSATKFAAKKISTAEGRFNTMLFEAIPPNESDHEKRFASRKNPDYPISYQLPIYYLALNQQDAYKNKIGNLILQLIRPTFPDNDAQGAIRLGKDVSESDAIRALTEQVRQDINIHIAQPVLTASTLPAVPGRQCDYCGFTGLCDASANDEEGDASAE